VWGGGSEAKGWWRDRGVRGRKMKKKNEEGERGVRGFHA